MKRLIISLGALMLVSMYGHTQSLDELNIQLHGYATQGLIYTTQNNWDTTDSSQGSPAWTEAVVNLSAQPTPKLRIGVQARYSLLGEYGNQITLDWASADYKFNEKFGVRFGKVKTPSSLMNEVQDIDPAYVWSLLPSGIYPLASRNFTLAHFGGVAYGTFSLGHSIGKLEYDGWGGERVLSSDDGYLRALKDEGIAVPNGLDGPTYGGTLRWHLPIQGAMIGVSDSHSALIGAISAGSLSGTLNVPNIKSPYFFGQYEHRRYAVSGEYSRQTYSAISGFTGAPTSTGLSDARLWYATSTYKVTDKLTAGVYYSSMFNLQAALGPSRYQKDWALSGRYDFNSFLYAKAEEHFLEGTSTGYSTSDNLAGLKPNTKMSLIKLGVSF